jgi:two-component sensor histidine kinase
MNSRLLKAVRSVSLWHFVWISVIFSEALTVLMSLIINGDVRRDYLIVGFFVPLIVAPAVVKLVIMGRSRLEEQLRRSLADKETLLNELHHRVKNNLQVISSLISLQSSNIKDEQTRELFNESRNRVQAMGLIHALLYKSDDLANISTSEYIRTLSIQLFKCYRMDPSLIKVETNVADIAMDIDTLIPFGLILNELVSNAYKHAFPDGRQGRLDIILENEGDSRVLTVKDDGVGVPEGFDPLSSSSLGMLIAKDLAAQINGSIEFSPVGSCEFRVIFKGKTPQR